MIRVEHIVQATQPEKYISYEEYYDTTDISKMIWYGRTENLFLQLRKLGGWRVVR